MNELKFNIIFAIIQVVIMFAGIWFASDLINTEYQRYELRLGKKYVLEKDTLLIVDYSALWETFTLSNGVKIDAELVFEKGVVGRINK